MLSKCGQRQLAVLAANPPGPSRLEAIYQLIKASGLSISSIQPKAVSSVAHKTRLKRRQTLPHPSEYQVMEGFLTTQQGEALTQLTDITPGSAGYVLCTHEQAAPWLQDGSTISGDASAIVLLGQPTITTKLDTTHLTIPCRDPQSRTVMISCTLVQSGEKPVTAIKMDQHHIAEDKATLVALTLLQEDWGQDWSQVTKNPAAWIRKIMGTEELIALWGKSFRRGRTPTTAQDATSIQLHATVRDAALGAFLSRTGFNGIWATPKTHDGKLSQAWKLVWLPANLDSSAIKILNAKTPGATGLAKVNQKFAIRVPRTQYEKAYQAVYPDAPVPPVLDTPRTFKIEGLPFGTTAPMLSQWLEHNKWVGKPLRALGPRGWIIGTSQDMPAGQLSFNTMPLLIRELAAQQPQQQIIIAGPKQKTAPKTEASSSWPLGDPWARWQGPKPSTDVAMGSAGPALPGPTETRLAQQDQRLQQLEETMTQIQAQQTTQTQTMQQMQSATQDFEQKTKLYIDSSMTAFRKEIDASFSTAVKAQSDQFNASMTELKQLLLAKRKTPEEGDQDMQQS
eukprot:Skav203969  [mRNA]  locus=scaffold94:394490:396184:- [translate_table: standard]